MNCLHPQSSILSNSKQQESFKKTQTNHSIFLKFVSFIGFIYLILSMVCIISWNLTENKPINKSKHIRKNTDVFRNEDPVFQSNQFNLQFLMIITFYKNLQQIQNHQLDQKQKEQFLDSYLFVDILAMNLYIFGLLAAQYIIFKSKQSCKGNHIQDYSLQIRNVPLLPVYILQPKLTQIIKKSVRDNCQGNIDEDIIFNMSSNYAQHNSYLQNLRNEIQNMNKEDGISQKNKIRKQILQKQISRLQIGQDCQTVTVWVTFNSRKNRYLAYRILSNRFLFVNNVLQIKKAPHPLQIKWQFLFQKKLTRIISKILGIFIFVVILMGFDLIILSIYKLQQKILGSIAVITLQMLFTVLILQIHKIQKHRTQSSQESSLFAKLTKYLYINTGLIIFISSYDFGNNFISITFSNRYFSQISKQWYETVGVNIMITAFIQIIYINARLLIQYIKIKVFKRCQKSEAGNIQSNLDMCYGQLVSILMVFQTYSFTHPFMHVMCLLVCFTAYFSHKKFFSMKYFKANYNNNRISYQAIDFLLIGVIIHQLIIFLLFKKISAIIFSIIISIFVLLKKTLYSKILQICRKKFGPLCFVSYRHCSTNTVVEQLLDKNQLQNTIKYLQKKKIIGMDEMRRQHQQNNHIHLKYYERYVNQIDKSIQKMQKYQNRITKKQYNYSLRGCLNYCIDDQK